METKTTFNTMFLIRNSRSKKGQSPIYCRITVNSERAEFSIKKSVIEKLWENGKVKGNTEDAKSINAYIKQIEAKIFEHYREMLATNKRVTADALKYTYLGIGSNEYTLMSLIEYHNNELKDTLEWGTMKNYLTTQKYVKLFLKEKLRTSDIYLSQLNYKFIFDFEMYVKAYQPLDHHKPCGQNTVMKHIERLRKMVNIAIRNEWHSKDPFAKFIPSFTKSTREFLSEIELTAIEEKVFSISRLVFVRDLFVFSYYTGLAYVSRQISLTTYN